MTRFPLYISGFGSCVPERQVTNKDLEAYVDTTHDWIVSRTGIEARHVLAADQSGSDLATEASLQALQRVGLTSEDLSHIMLATCTPDTLCPGDACTLARKLTAKPRMAFDLGAACSGFMYGLHVGRSLLVTEPQSRVLLACVEALSRRMNWKDRSSCVLFGDGAGSVLLTKEPLPQANVSAQLLSLDFGTDCRYDDLIVVGGGTQHEYLLGETIREDFFLSLKGREVFKLAVRNMVSVAKSATEQAGLNLSDIDLLVPHQANLRIIEAVGERLDITGDRVFVNVQKYGNTSAASIPLALAEALESKRIQPGMKVLLVSFGAGLTWSGAVLQF